MIAEKEKMIYNVYHKGGSVMQATISKWGNSLGLRIPTIAIRALNIKSGDTVSYDIKDNSLIIRKENLQSLILAY